MPLDEYQGSVAAYRHADETDSFAAIAAAERWGDA